MRGLVYANLSDYLYCTLIIIDLWHTGLNMAFEMSLSIQEIRYTLYFNESVSKVYNGKGPFRKHYWGVVAFQVLLAKFRCISPF